MVQNKEARFLWPTVYTLVDTTLVTLHLRSGFAGDDDVQRSTTVSYTMEPGCECGCALNQLSGYIVSSSSTHCASATSRRRRVWSVRVPDGLVVQLKFIRFTSPSRGAVVRVHDGNSSLSNLLVQLDDGAAQLPPPLTSAGNVLRVEHVLPPRELFDTQHDANHDDDNVTFVALFTAVSAYTRSFRFTNN